MNYSRGLAAKYPKTGPGNFGASFSSQEEHTPLNLDAPKKKRKTQSLKEIKNGAVYKLFVKETTHFPASCSPAQRPAIAGVAVTGDTSQAQKGVASRRR